MYECERERVVSILLFATRWAFATWSATFLHTPSWICNGTPFEFQYFFICIEIICQAANPNRSMELYTKFIRASRDDEHTNSDYKNRDEHENNFFLLKFIASNTIWNCHVTTSLFCIHRCTLLCFVCTSIVLHVGHVHLSSISFIKRHAPNADTNKRRKTWSQKGTRSLQRHLRYHFRYSFNGLLDRCFFSISFILEMFTILAIIWYSVHLYDEQKNICHSCLNDAWVKL